jgi:hypothetical protein
MSNWYTILALLAFTVNWPFLDSGMRNAWRRRARRQRRTRTELDADA